MVNHYKAEVLSQVDYYPFGKEQPGRSYNSIPYPYAFNGNRMKNAALYISNIYNYGMRNYDTRIGMYYFVDPLSSKYPYLTPYQYAGNNPITNIDIGGLVGIPFTLTSPFTSDLAIQQTLYDGNISKGLSSQKAYTQSFHQFIGIKVGEVAAVVGAAYLVSDAGLIGAARTLYGLLKGTKKLKSNVDRKANLRMSKDIKNVRRRAVSKAWKQEKKLIEKTGQGTRRWTEAEKKELIEKGKVEGYEGHHINSVKDHPDKVGNPDNVEFLRGRKEHLKKHGGNFKNETTGELKKRKRRLEKY